eukprot:CCRYP_010832-RA/>CCRYP_010832-RA protein AED:0.05 eAED:0.05 QI:418/1/1/1/1/1/7/44/883
MRRERMRNDWKRAFDEIREGRILMSKLDDMPGEKEEGRLLDRWKEFLDAGAVGGANAVTNGDVTGDEDEDVQSGRDESANLDENDVTKQIMKKKSPLRFDGFQTWETQLQQWSDEVSAYLSETEVQWSELLKSKESSGYELGKFGLSSQGLKDLTKSARRDKFEQADDSGKDENVPSSKATSTLKRFRLDTTTTPIGTLPIALTALEPSLPKLPKPRPVTSSDTIVPHTDIADLTKNIWIVTTASLPWMTGTAVNPLLRAAYLTAGRKQMGGSVTLMLPWVERPADQERIYGKAERFANQKEQEEYVRDWLRDVADLKEASVDLRIRWYTAWQEVAENSLYSMGDIIGLIPEEECDICVLEEPEHLNWYRAPGENWTSKFKHVVGIVHTNYFVYAQEQPAAFIRAPGMRLLCSWMCRAHCHRLIKLSGTLGNFAPEKELVENVHGVRRTFLDIGQELRSKLTAPEAASDPVFSADAAPKVYFIGKMLWSKGLGSLMDLMKYAEESSGLKVTVDMYGGGPNKDEASEKAKSMGLDMPFHGPIDHAELGFSHKIFINPSLSEVLCTTVAEALAMGKFVVLPNHPSNDFFAQFPNCLPYSNKEEFIGNLYYALTHAPEPLTDEYSYALSWEAATERFAAAGSVSVAEAKATKEALESAEAGFDIVLPPLTTSEERRKKISATFRRTRGRYRNFRKRLSQEISKTNVLPKELQQRLITELDKRLDVDLDELLSSPKLRVRLSPAKLDKLLLELYDSVTEGPSGDVFRVIGGGANVGMQNLYLKQQQSKMAKMGYLEEFPHDPTDSTPTGLVKRALSRNFRKWQLANDDDTLSSAETTAKAPTRRRQKQIPKMSLVNSTPRSEAVLRSVYSGSFAQHRPSMPRYSPLI